MDFVEQMQEDALANFQDNIEPGRLSGILLYWNGTNATATPGDYGDLGSIRIKRDGETIHDRPIEEYADMANIRGGSNKFSSVGSGAIVATAFIPFFELGLDQAMIIEGEKELNFAYQQADGAVFSSLQVTVFAVQSFLDEDYQYFILGNDQTPGGVWNSKTVQLNTDNITSVYLRDASSILTDIGLRSDGQEKVSDQPKDVVEAGTLLENRLEVNNFSQLLLRTFTIGNPLSVFNEKNVLKLTTSAGGSEIRITICSIRPHNRGRLARRNN